MAFGAGGDEAGGVEDAGDGLVCDEGAGEGDVHGGGVEGCGDGGVFVERGRDVGRSVGGDGGEVWVRRRVQWWGIV